MKKLTEFNEILDKKSFLHLAFVKKDGSPHSTPIWMDDDRENNIIYINTATGRVKTHLNVGSKVAGSIIDPDNPYNFLGFEGAIIHKTVGDSSADDHIDALAKKYLGQDKYPNRSDTETRIKLTIKVDKVFGT